MTTVQSIIGVAGASGAGKSRLANELLRRMLQRRSATEIAILNEDCYYRRRDDLTLDQRSEINYDHPDAIEHEMLIDHLLRLKSGQAVEVPVYDYSVHNRSEQTTTLKPATILILEGILILHRPELRELLNLKLFVDVPLDICLARRMERDIVERKRSLRSVLDQYHDTVRPMFFEYIYPSKNHADLIIPRGGQNQHAIEVLEGHLDRVLS